MACELFLLILSMTGLNCWMQFSTLELLLLSNGGLYMFPIVIGLINWLTFDLNKQVSPNIKFFVKFLNLICKGMFAAHPALIY